MMKIWFVYILSILSSVHLSGRDNSLPSQSLMDEDLRSALIVYKISSNDQVASVESIVNELTKLLDMPKEEFCKNEVKKKVTSIDPDDDTLPDIEYPAPYTDSFQNKYETLLHIIEIALLNDTLFEKITVKQLVEVRRRMEWKYKLQGYYLKVFANLYLKKKSYQNAVKVCREILENQSSFADINYASAILYRIPKKEHFIQSYRYVVPNETVNENDNEIVGLLYTLVRYSEYNRSEYTQGKFIDIKEVIKLLPDKVKQKKITIGKREVTFEKAIKEALIKGGKTEGNFSLE